MIDLKTLSADWLTVKRKKYGKDPSLMESMVYALYLLEQLKLTGLDFIFKGGTSLVLLMEQPRRFSVDIDIIVNPQVTKELLESHLVKIIENNAFIRMELDEKRSYKGGIPKAHYKFIFNSNFSNRNIEGDVISNPEREILLDILFAENHYPILVDRPIQTEWLIQQDEPIFVTTPDINSITGDKLSAFAPNTTGVPYGVEKEKEILKQLFDVGCLFDLLTDLDIFKRSFIDSAKGEIAYRPERKIKSVEQILRDIIDTAILIANHNVLKNDEDKAKFIEIKTGINQFGHYVYDGNFGILEAQVASAKAAYLAAIILSDYKGEIQKHDTSISPSEYLIKNTEFNFLNKRLKFVTQGKALFYWFQAINLLFPENK
jgi:hypothetical protein